MSASSAPASAAAHASGKERKTKKYSITLNFSFSHSHSGRYGEPSKAEECAFARADKHFAEKGGVEAHVKSFDAMEFVMYILLDANVLEAKWDDTKFAVHMVVESKDSAAKIKEELETNSLEDGEYESCGDNGWTVKTIPAAGSDDIWEYGLTDYRGNPIVIKPIKE
jgi:hypothetical protein